MATQRYLTPDAKARELAAFADLRENGTPTGNQAGRGYPDPDILPWCDRLNALEGLCTLQSCSGHAPRNGDPGPHTGKLWIWLSRPMARAFAERAPELAREDGIEEVATRFASWGQEFAAVTFAGNDRDSLPASMRAITSFFEALDA